MKVKRFISVLASSLVLVLGLSTSVAVAITTTQTNDTRTTAATNTTVAAANQTTTLSADDKAKLLQRLTERKAELKTRLTTAQKTKLQTKCKAAQGLLSPVREKIKGYETARSNVYGGVLSKLTDLSTKLKAQDVSTTQLDAAVTTLQGKITTFNTDLTSYKQAVSDMTDMDCASDPDAFEASLVAARTALQKVNQDATDIRNYVKDNLKPILATLKTDLQNKKTGNQ
jgi:hypothetical protein